MSAPRISHVAPGSAAERAGLTVGDEVLSIDGAEPLDVIEWQQMTDGGDLELLVRRLGAPIDRRMRVLKSEGEPLGARVDSAVFDRIRTCDNHCEFCFIYQLPKGMRKSLYLKDDDYRLSFLYGNFTTLTRFTELDAEKRLALQEEKQQLEQAMSQIPKVKARLKFLQDLLQSNESPLVPEDVGASASSLSMSAPLVGAFAVDSAGSQA